MPAICNNCCAMAGLRIISFTWPEALRLARRLPTPMKTSTRTVATTAELLEWMRLAARNAKLVSVSSAAVYGAGHTGPIREEDALLPFSPYGYHKLMMENLCQSYAVNYGLSVMVVRLFSVYGSWLKKQLLWDMCSSLACGHAAIGAGWHRRGIARLDRHPRCGARFGVRHGAGHRTRARWRSSMWARDKRRA